MENLSLDNRKNMFLFFFHFLKIDQFSFLNYCYTCSNSTVAQTATAARTATAAQTASTAFIVTPVTSVTSVTSLADSDLYTNTQESIDQYFSHGPHL